jgi:DNA-binding IclR family transcriptional regulator
VDGKVLLSQLDEYQVANILNSLETEIKADGEVAGTDALLSRIKVIRQRGYAVGHNEFTLGVSCISAPVRNYALPVVLNLVGPEFRVKPRLQDFTAALIGSADRISSMLAGGYRAHTD